MIRATCLLLLAGVFLPFFIHAQGFLKTEGKKIVDENGEAYIIKGMGLGGWMLQEGYMLRTSGFADTQHEIENHIAEVTSESFKNRFYDAWLANHFRRIDLDSLKAWGFNSVRVAMHYKWFTPPIQQEPVQGEVTWKERGFRMLDTLLKWCEENRMYLILDLHAAPGGQGYNASISDYDPDKPSLWESEFNKKKTAALWKKLADRYADEPWIGGYDLINETNWTFEGHTEGDNARNGCQDKENEPLHDLLVRITDSIRQVDQNHIIFIEGNCWANNFNGLTPPWDDNMVYSFHKYWNPNTQEAIQEFVDMREEYDIPLWLGETGENSNTWYTNCIRLLDQHQIGWAWWPEKQLGDQNNPLTVKTNPGYKDLLEYWRGNGPKPTKEQARDALMQLADNLKLENCTYNKDVIDAMFRQTRTSETKPYKDHALPGKVYAVDYDLGRVNHAYYDQDYSNTDFGGPTNRGGAYRNDGVDIEPCSDQTTNGYNVGWIEDGEWLQYTIEVKESGSYAFSFRVASEQAGGTFHLKMDGNRLGDKITVPNTGGYQRWQTVEMDPVQLGAGKHTFRIEVETGGFNLNFFRAQPATMAQSRSKADELKLLYARDHIRVKVPETYNRPVQADVVDLEGCVHQPKMLRNDEYIRFSVHSLKPGMYFVRIRSNHYGTAPFVV
jgi:hypothetical protein